MATEFLPDELRGDVQTLWDYHRLDDELRPVDVAVGLGGHDSGVAIHTADLYAQGLFPLIVFTGANAPATVDRFPRGEAVHYREIAMERGVPDAAILIETEARNTGDNIALTRKLLEDRGIDVGSALLASRPYQQRRAFATAKKLWPGIDILCSSQRMTLDDYLAGSGDVDHVVNMLVGDTQRITAYAQAGFAIEQHVPDVVQTAYARLVEAGYTSRLVAEQR
ncbi:uncharacterized SAM-binding protein YcdF (DUF218 family) [Halopolyspora algeriensis]|uniref:Uncharacterized SAM-binding protein YcdF (DUF218 family) n=1 Tax=Halopolyspora algeriensis TaxID=1500506 RepID=A0A368VFT8_9ACTN|nr:YdcF family protein [Halopolyspora algeriensis]RCW38534.1 uncharacterized SAM-binding protein YcdF (DUF218 family) [Halopolyspora algeriensis]TQM42615.1 DUF218 domain-containing protein [Halopolyspora algeriensis]